MAECWRVLKPTGSTFVNLGDKRSGSGGHNNSGLAKPHTGSITFAGQAKNAASRPDTRDRERLATRRNAPDRYNQAAFGRPKSKMLLPHRFAIGCEDGLADPEGEGWIVRQDHVWHKSNGLPESAVDRCRDSHEYVFHLTKEERYFAAVDEVREQGAGWRRPGAPWLAHAEGNVLGRAEAPHCGLAGYEPNPLGKLPSSVWTIPSEPLRVPEHLGLEHFAAFPTALPLRCIKGWSPSGICVECGDGRRPIWARPDGSAPDEVRRLYDRKAAFHETYKGLGGQAHQDWLDANPKQRIGYTCACPDTSAPTRPAVVLDPFGGTGTTAAVARVLGRVGVSVDLSSDYCRLARWRIWESGDGERAVFGERPPKQLPGQLELL